MSFLHRSGVFRDRNHLIRLAHHMQKGNLGIGQAFKPIEWQTFEAGCLLFGESIGLQTSFPSFSENPFPVPWPAGQLLKSRTGASA